MIPPNTLRQRAGFQVDGIAAQISFQYVNIEVSVQSQNNENIFDFSIAGECGRLGRGILRGMDDSRLGEISDG
jgi:hypothetical protein